MRVRLKREPAEKFARDREVCYPRQAVNDQMGLMVGALRHTRARQLNRRPETMLELQYLDERVRTSLTPSWKNTVNRTVFR